VLLFSMKNLVLTFLSRKRMIVEKKKENDDKAESEGTVHVDV